jgi:type II secretion system protein J
MSKHHTLSGFTLLEVLVTLFILMIVGILISTGLNTVMRTHESIDKRSKILAEVQLAVIAIEHDMQQASNARISNKQGQELPNFILRDNSIEFTISGVLDPVNMNPNNTLQRITYKREGNVLVRYVRNIVNNVPQEKFRKHVLFNRIKSFHCSMTPRDNILMHTREQNPTMNQKNNPIIGVIFEINTAELGRIIRVMPLAINTLDEKN